MFTLDTTIENINAFATLGTFFLGIVTLILGVISMLQDKQIKKLTEIVTHLEKTAQEQASQTKILSQRLDLEKAVSITDRTPFFQPSSYSETPPHKLYMTLVNHGLTARDIKIVEQSIENWSIVPQENEVPKGRYLQLHIYSSIGKIDGYMFTIEYKTPFGDKLYQTIKKNEGENWQVSPPVPINLDFQA